MTTPRDFAATKVQALKARILRLLVGERAFAALCHAVDALERFLERLERDE